MNNPLGGIPLYQIMEMHRHVQTVKRVLPSLDVLSRSEVGSHHPDNLRKLFASMADEQLCALAYALSGLISCDRVVGLVEVPIQIEGDVSVLKPFVPAVAPS